MTHSAQHGPARDPRGALLRRRLAGMSSSPRSEIPRVSRDGPLPLSYGQQQMWFINRLDPGSTEYNVPLCLRLRGALDTPALQRAWAWTVARHEVLRTRYTVVDGAPTQVVDPPDDVGLALDDLRGLPPGERRERVDALLAGEVAVAFDLEVEWPVRARLLRLTDDEYVLSIVFHHICWDAWSLGVLGADLNAAYRALTEGGPMPPELPVQYADYAAWQHTEMSGPVLERHLHYWRAQLDGNLPVDLPADRPRPAVRSHTGAAAPFVVPAGLARRLDDIGQRLGTTPFVVMLTAFAVLVARYTGRSDVAIGTVVSDRNRPELENLIGYGINTLVMRAVWDGSMSFENLIQRMRTTVLDAYDHQAVPFARLVDELAADRDLARTPLFQVAYTSHTSPDRLVRLPGIRMEQYGDGEAVAKWDLELQTCQAEDGSVHSRLVYPTALFDDATMARMARHLLRLLERVADDPAAPAAGHDLLDEAERALVLGVAVDSGPSDGDGNRVGGVAVDPRCVPEVFEDQAAATPDAVAVRCGDSELSYAEVNVRANRVAHLLRARGVGAESLVAVLLDRGVDLVPVLLGVLKAGAGYLPLDPANPTRRLRHAIADSGAALVVTCVDLRETARLCHDGALIVLDAAREAETLAAQPVDNPASVVTPDGVMYVIYTSGSTGQPKGVCVTHANVDRLLRTAREHLAYGPADVWTLFHSYAFDVSVFEMWGALLSGGTLVVVPQGVTRSPDDLLDLLVDRRVTVLSQTPSAFRALVAAAETGDPRVDRLSLRVIVFAGEKLDVPSLRPWAARVGLNRTALINMYGITETTVHATYHRVTPADFDPVVGSPIGRPLADLTIRLLDDEGRPVPIGVPGEIYVGGPGLARGYLRRPGLTAARFLPDPFGAPGSRRYRSGDLARRLPDGQLRFLRRADDQAKIRGYRVEPGEIRAVLLAHPAVRDAAVIVDEVSPGEHRLIAYVVPAVPDLAEGDLGAHCGSLLPPYMVPAAIVPLPAIPLTANGKLDRGKLPVPDRSALVGTVRYLAPRSSAEERMAEVWRAVLRVDRVGVLDSFFDLGGDSIRAVALVGQLRTAGFDVSVRDVFERRTVARLCELADARPAAEGAIVAVEPFALITPADRRRLPADLVDAYPMGQTQLGMVADMLAHRRLSNYHNVASIRIRDGWPLSADALRAAAQILVGRHEVLRTSFDLHSCSVPMQLVHADADLPVRIRDLRGLDAAGIHRQMEQFHADERTCPFDLACPPMMRLTAHVTDDGWWLSITEFHAIVEGWSYHSLIRELFDCYEAIRAGRQPASEPVPAVRYADVVASELRALSSPEDRAYWRRVVESVEPFSLPSGWGGTGPSESYWVHVPFGDLEPGLRRLAAAAGASLKSVVVAAYGAVLGRLTYRNEFSAGLVTHTRPEAAGAERVYGMHLNTVPFVFERGRWTWRELVAAVFAQEVAMWPHRHFPMPQMQRLAGGRRIVNVLLNFVNFDDLEPDSPALDLASTMTPGTTEFDLAVTTVGRRISLKSHTRVLGRGRAERLAAMYRGVLEAMAADPDGDASGVFLSPEDGVVVGGLNRGVGELVGVSVGEAFGAQVAARPDAVAVVAGAAVVSYAELDRYADRVACRLRSLGVGPESVVGVHLERGVGLVAGLLGVWKAGGAYLPIDKSMPSERVGYLVADAGVGVVVDEAFLEGLPSGGGERGRWGWSAPDPDQLAYVVYTSGSTGRPKGVGVTHRSLANRVDWSVRRHRMSAQDRTLQKTSIGFDAAGWEVFAPLASGGTVVAAPAGVERDPAALVRAVAEHGVTVLQVVPSVLRLLVQTPGWRDCGALRVLTVAGEQLESELCQRFLDLRQAEVWNTYGPTECTIDVTAYHYAPDRLAGPVPIGRPLPNVTAYVVDAAMQPVPVGVVGELYVGGVAVARGYLNRPGLTAGRFVPDPFGPPGSRLYRTGDLVSLSDDGALTFRGRVDDQLKINGVRIEPGEVAAAVRQLPSIAAAAVVPWRTGDGEVRLAAYVVPEDAGQLDQRALRRGLARTLADAMLPAVFVPLDRLPLTAHGKLDRRALPEPELTSPHARVPPSTPTERALAQVWSAVLGRERVGVHDTLLDGGANSLTIIRVIAAARRRRIPLTLRMFYENDTLADLAAAVDALPADAQPAEEPPTEDRSMTTDGRSTGPAEAAGAALIEPGALIEVMARHHVPGVSVALLRGGEVVHAQGYGVTAADRPEPVTTRTPFQVASISKHVTMLGVLRLVADGVLNLDADINGYLTSWRVPGDAVITLRELVSHQSGLSHVPATNHLPGETMPTVVEILNGCPPARNEPVHAQHRAGDVFKKTNINYSVLEQLLVDVTGEPFDALIQRLVLDPLEMTDSSFDQDHPQRSTIPAAIGHDAYGDPIAGRWRVRNEVAAGGLWASVRDLTKVALAVRRSYQGQPGALLTRPLAQQMVTVWHPGSFYGLGTVVDPSDGDVEYGHGGRTVGFRCMTVTRVVSGDGLIVLANGENGKRAHLALVEALRRADASAAASPFGRSWAETPDEPVEAPGRPAHAGGLR